VSSIKKDYYILILFVLSLIFTNELIYLFFNISIGPDFTVYSSYFDYFFLEDKTATREQGLFYFYLQSISAKLTFQNFSLDYSKFFLHKSIQQINSLIYIYGLLGYYFLLNKFNFKKKNIYLTLIFLNFFPLTFALRMTLKPEILAFSLLPWLLYFLELYLEKNKFQYLFFTIPYIAIIATSKGSIFVICALFVCFGYLIKIYKKNIKYFFIFVVLVLVSIFSLNYENLESGGNSLFNIRSGAGEEITEEALRYDNKASVSFAYKVNMFNLFTSPIKHNHKDSFISITLLDTFDDYFDLYWNNNDTLFNKDRLEIVELEKSNLIQSPKLNDQKNKLTVFVQKDTDLYLRPTVALIISILFYTVLIKNIFTSKKYRYFLSAPIFGAFLLIVHVISGFPKNNFDPTKGDTLKPFYYSFLICLAFVFLVINLLEKRGFYSILLIPYIIFMLFLFGFPKELDNQRNALLDVNSESTICEINNFFISEYKESTNCSSNLIGNDKDLFVKFSKKIVNVPINLFFLVFLLFSNLYLIYESNYLGSAFKKLPLKINKNNKE